MSSRRNRRLRSKRKTRNERRSMRRDRIKRIKCNSKTDIIKASKKKKGKIVEEASEDLRK